MITRMMFASWREFFVTSGIDTLSFSTGKAALEHLFDSNQRLPNLVLLDLILPHLHGFDVLRAIRQNERTSQLPVVIVAVSAQEREALKYYQVGISGFLVKPVQLDDLSPFLPKDNGNHDSEKMRLT